MRRRSFLAAGAGALAAGLAGRVAGAPTPRARALVPVRFVANPALATRAPDPHWPGTPVAANGQFVNLEYPFVQSGGAFLRFLLERNPQRAAKQADTFQLPVQETTAFLTGSDDVVVWLGHASFYVRLGGVALLLDPVLGRLPVGGRRLSRLPCPPAAFTGISYILLTHAHYDHCDKPSLRRLYAQNPGVRFLTGLGTDTLLRRWLPGAPVQAAGWYQQYDTGPVLRVAFLPTRHWSNRTLGDINRTLWGAFVLQGGGRQVYCGGDSGYGGHFRDVGRLFPGLDVALLGAGAYAPRWFMAPNHQDPAHAVQAFHDTGARVLVPMHYGTFALSREPVGEAPRQLAAYRDTGQLRGSLRLLAVGESLQPSD